MVSGKQQGATGPGEVDRAEGTGRGLRRRDVLASSLVLGFGAAGASWAPAAAAAAAGDSVLPATPEAQLRDVVRLQGSLREEDVPWWFTGVIFAVTGDHETPRPLLRFEGMEIYWFAHLADGYLLGGNTVTFFRDFDTHEYLAELPPWNVWTRSSRRSRAATSGSSTRPRASGRRGWTELPSPSRDERHSRSSGTA